MQNRTDGKRVGEGSDSATVPKCAVKGGGGDIMQDTFSTSLLGFEVTSNYAKGKETFVIALARGKKIHNGERKILLQDFPELSCFAKDG